MKIELDIPDWATERMIYIISGTELVAFKKIGSDTWNTKLVRCNQCGRCCLVHPKNGAYFPLREDGSCSKLVDDGSNRKVCTLGMEKPMACVIGEPEGEEYTRFDCCIAYKEVKDR